MDNPFSRVEVDLIEKYGLAVWPKGDIWQAAKVSFHEGRGDDGFLGYNRSEAGKGSSILEAIYDYIKEK